MFSPGQEGACACFPPARRGPPQCVRPRSSLGPSHPTPPGHRAMPAACAAGTPCLQGCREAGQGAPHRQQGEWGLAHPAGGLYAVGRTPSHGPPPPHRQSCARPCPALPCPAPPAPPLPCRSGRRRMHSVRSACHARPPPTALWCSTRTAIRSPGARPSSTWGSECGGEGQHQGTAAAVAAAAATLRRSPVHVACARSCWSRRPCCAGQKNCALICCPLR